jgi:hypothetical protein
VESRMLAGLNSGSVLEGCFSKGLHLSTTSLLYALPPLRDSGLLALLGPSVGSRVACHPAQEACGLGLLPAGHDDDGLVARGKRRCLLLGALWPLHLHWMRWRWHGWLWWWWLWHRPHVHGDGPVGLDHCLPDLWEDDLAIWANKIVMALVDVRTNDVNVKERLLNELLHALRIC